MFSYGEEPSNNTTQNQPTPTKILMQTSWFQTNLQVYLRPESNKLRKLTSNNWGTNLFFQASADQLLWCWEILHSKTIPFVVRIFFFPSKCQPEWNCKNNANAIFGKSFSQSTVAIGCIFGSLMFYYFKCRQLQYQSYWNNEPHVFWRYLFSCSSDSHVVQLV